MFAHYHPENIKAQTYGLLIPKGNLKNTVFAERENNQYFQRRCLVCALSLHEEQE